MKTINLALIGFGNVGQGFTHILKDKAKVYETNFGLKICISAVSDMQYGSLYNPDGLDPATLLSAVQEKGTLTEIPGALAYGWDAKTTIAESNSDIVVEISFTDLNTGEPATAHIRQALEARKHVVTTNKGPVALHYAELIQLAQKNRVQIGLEGTVMSGTPAMHLAIDLLSGAGIKKIQGILNGTTNYMLSEMEKGLSYGDALADAQRLGYAEADPTGDVEGFDAAGKVVILSNVLLGKPLSMEQVDRTGISGITQGMIKQAQKDGKRWKLIGMLEIAGEEVNASVKPMCLPLEHPLAAVGGATNAITYTTEQLGDVTLVGAGAGRIETGYALICDLLSIYR
jgi:homoserine dehydrogenase